MYIIENGQDFIISKSIYSQLATNISVQNWCDLKQYSYSLNRLASFQLYFSQVPGKKKQAIPEKNSGERGVEDMDFPGVSKKQHAELTDVNSLQSGIYRFEQEKIMWTFQGSCVFGLGISRKAETQF